MWGGHSWFINRAAAAFQAALAERKLGGKAEAMPH
jgi:hypothetical protein